MANRLHEPKQIWLGPKSLLEDATESVKFSESIVVRDLTLREGEQAADISFSVEDKLKIAEKLKEIGVTHIQAGMPGRSEIDRQVFVKLQDIGIAVDALILAFGLNWKEEIDVAVSVGAKLVDIVFPCSEYRLKGVMNLSQKQMLSICREAITYAKQKGLGVSFTPTDSTRTSLQFLREIGEMAFEAGADSLFIADTVGVAIPEVMRAIIRSLRSLSIKLGVHAHNDFGLAVANALAAVQEGATFVDVCINGFAERAGGVALDEFVVVVQEIFHQPLGIQTKKLYELSKLVEELTSISVPPTKPFMGRNVFSHKSDAHVAGVMKYMPAYQGIAPRLVGRKIDVVLGSLAGPNTIRTKAQDLGIKVEEDIINNIIKIVRQKALSLRRALTNSEFMDIVLKIKQKGG